MYNYQKMKKGGGDNPLLLPSDDMRVNGRSLSEWVPGYRQLTVSGRGLLEQKVTTTDIPGRRGLWVEDVIDSERILEIKYKLEATSSEGLREKFANLNKVLRTLSQDGFLNLVFADEPGFTYYALYSEAEDIEETGLSVISKFSLLVPDGYKKKDPQNSTGLISLTHAIEVLPDSIIVTVSKTTDNVQIINRDKVLSFRGSYQQGKDIELDFREDEVTIRYDNRSILSELERFSPLEVFTIKNRDTLTAKNASIKRVVWRDEQA
ncbi:phage tail family protein [Streptococcus danieliae]|nr:phage tail family protein [Streptococcus danieliae]